MDIQKYAAVLFVFTDKEQEFLAILFLFYESIHLPPNLASFID